MTHEFGKKNVANLYLFRGAPLVTTFFHSVGSRTKAVGNFLEKISRADIRLEELKHSSLKKILLFCSGRVPIYVHSCFY